jgi:hypothetical protein
LAGLGIPVQEAQHVGDGGPPPPINCLVIIRDNRHVAVAGGQELHHVELGVVGVLEFVDQDVPIAPLIGPQHVGSRAEEPEYQHNLVAEVHAALAGHQLLVLGVGRGQLSLLGGALARFLVVGGRGRFPGQALGVGLIFLGRDVLVLAAADQGDQGLQVAGGIAQRSIVAEGQLEEPVAQEYHLLGPVQHAEVGREANLQGVLAQDAVAEGVEGGDLDVGVAVGHQRVDPLLHLGGGLVGERHRQDLFGARLALSDEPSNAAGDDAGLAGSGAGDDEKGARVVGHGRALGHVEAFEDPVDGHAASNYTPAG